MLCYTIFFHLSASLEVTHNGTSSLGLPFGRDIPQTQSPWIVALYDRYNENIAKTTLTRNVLLIPPFSLCTVVQLSLLTPRAKALRMAPLFSFSLVYLTLDPIHSFQNIFTLDPKRVFLVTTILPLRAASGGKDVILQSCIFFADNLKLLANTNIL